MSEKINPYQQLGAEFDPFGVAIKFNLPFPLAEAFKKFACAGIDGRVKSKEQDIKEAIYSVNRAIEYIKNYSFRMDCKASKSDCDSVNEMYARVFGEEYVKSLEFKYAKFILWYAVTADIKVLERIVSRE